MCVCSEGQFNGLGLFGNRLKTKRWSNTASQPHSELAVEWDGGWAGITGWLQPRAAKTRDSPEKYPLPKFTRKKNKERNRGK